MIDNKYIVLINKDIDKTISQLEKKILEEHLEINSDAKELHKELLRTEELLDQLPDREPSVNLKKRILNSIDYNRYSETKKKSLFSEYFGNLITGSPRKIAISFALVLIIGSLILFNIYIVPNINNDLADQNVYGTMGLHKAELLEVLSIDEGKISGDIQINREADYYKFKIDVNSVDKYNLQIEFDPNNISIEQYPNENNVTISENKSSISFTNSTRLSKELVFKSNKQSEDKFSIKLFNENNKIFQQEIVLAKP